MLIARATSTGNGRGCYLTLLIADCQHVDIYISDSSLVVGHQSFPLLYGSRMFCYALQVGDTALHMASLQGHEEVVRLLLQSGVKDVTNKVCI